MLGYVAPLVLINKYNNKAWTIVYNVTLKNKIFLYICIKLYINTTTFFSHLLVY